MRTRRLLAILTLLVGLITLFHAIQLYRTPTIIIEWSTASEFDVAGFNILRGDTNEGPFTQINPTLIPPSDDPLQGGEYEYEDKAIQRGKIYFYQLQEVALSGETILHEPIVEANASPGGRIEAILGGVLIILSISLGLFTKPRE